MIARLQVGKTLRIPVYGHSSRAIVSKHSLVQVILRHASRIATPSSSGVAGRSEGVFPGPQIEGSGSCPARPVGSSIHQGTNVIPPAFDNHVFGPPALDENLAAFVDTASGTVVISKRQVNRLDPVRKPAQGEIDTTFHAILRLVAKGQLL